MVVNREFKNITIVDCVWKLLTLLIFGTTFIYSDLFINTSTLPQMYWYIFVNLFGVGILLCFGKSIHLKLDTFSLLLFVFVTYLLIRFFLSFQERLLYGSVIICFLLSYLIFKSFTVKEVKFCNFNIVSICFIVSILIIFDRVIGWQFIRSFDNIAGFAICLSIGFPFCLYYATERSKWKCFFYGIAFCTCIAMLLLGSRAGMMSILINALIYWYNKKVFHVKPNLYLYFGILLLVGILIIFFFIKYDSAIGRMLIWRVTLNIVSDYPIWGIGYDAFIDKYMMYQADLFETTFLGVSELLADNVLFPFNEYLSLLCEFGIVGFCLLGLLVLYLISKGQKCSLHIQGLIAIAVFACFSYPLHYLYSAIVISYCLAISSNGMEQIKWNVSFLQKNNCYVIVGIILIIGNLCVLIKDVGFEYQWKKLVDQKKSDMSVEVKNRYEELFKNWNGNPFFLYNYGAELRSIRNYEESNYILQYCKRYFNDYDVQLLLAHNYYDVKDYNKAKEYYWLAYHMCPNRFIPLYRLSLIYEQFGNQEKVREIDMMILNKKVKIPSSTVSQIRTRIRMKYNNQ